MALDIDLLNPLMDHDPLALAVSGGPDSMALMGAVHQWCVAQNVPVQNLGRQVHVLCVDHGLREEAKREADEVCAKARRWGFQAEKLVLQWNGERPTSQAAFREARYKALFGYIKAHKITALGLAHHANDQAETIVMRLAHQSGLEGLGGMKAVQTRQYDGHNILLYRPFLTVTKKDLMAFCDDHGHTFLNDSSNQNIQFERVRVRQHWASLEALGLHTDRLGLFAARIERGNQALDYYVDQFLQEQMRIDSLMRGQLPVKAFQHIPNEIGIRTLTRLLDMLGGATAKAELNQIERLHTSILSGDISKTHSLGGCLVRVRENTLQIYRELGRFDPTPAVLDPGRTTIFDQRWKITNITSKSLTIAPFGLKGKKWCWAHLPHQAVYHPEARASSPAVYEGEKCMQALDFEPFGAMVKMQRLV